MGRPQPSRIFAAGVGYYKFRYRQFKPHIYYDASRSRYEAGNKDSAAPRILWLPWSSINTTARRSFRFHSPEILTVGRARKDASGLASSLPIIFSSRTTAEYLRFRPEFSPPATLDCRLFSVMARNTRPFSFAPIRGIFPT